MKDIQGTDLLEYSIDLMKNARPIKEKTPRYIAKKRDFINKIFPTKKDCDVVRTECLKVNQECIKKHQELRY